MNTEDGGTKEGTNVYDSGTKASGPQELKSRESNSSRRRRIRVGPRGSRDRFSLACIFCLTKEGRGKNGELCAYIYVYTPCEPRSYDEPNDYAIVSTTASVMTADEARFDRRRIEGPLDKKKKKKKRRTKGKKKKRKRKGKKKKKKDGKKREKQRERGVVIDRERSSLVLRCPYLI